MQAAQLKIVVSPVRVRVSPLPKGPPELVTRPGGSPVFRVCEAGGPRADPDAVRRGGITSSPLTRPPRSAYPTSPFDHDAAVSHSPDDGPDDQRLTGERSESIPDRRLERVAELVASGPPLDVDQLIAIESTEHDAVRATAAAGPAAEGTWQPSRRVPRVPARPTRRAGARAGPGGAAPDGCARTRARKACGKAHLGGPYTSGTNERATRARRAAGWAVVSSSGSGPDSARPARPGRSGTTPRARGRGRSSVAGAWLVRRRAEVDLVRPHRADPARRRRPGGYPCQPWRFGSRTGESTASTARPLDPRRP